ncbi:MAG TPA: type II toxin-antitoxin system VapC family toxin [Bryobacteraceae bacterium]|nr:VapC toxin family PIN domain ribonuclease [Bryobacterales bacterium]HRJ18210.1 type II toxin-antitoxin system VapC family toxin [Bryobacteraceae bacterium]
MVAVDTNVLVRFLVDDDPDQSRAARALFASEAVWIPKTVILETNWVLCSLFGLTDVEVARALSRLLSVENVQIEDSTAVGDALALVERGMELADALHLLSRPRDARFVSFDKQLVRRARRAGADRVEELR